MEWMLMPLKRYADFSGRSRRKEYWMFALLIFLISMVILLATGALTSGFSDPGGLLASPVFILLGVLWLAIIIPSLAVQVRRFHDQDKSGWFALINLIPYIGGLIVFVFMLMEGTKGPNRFGADPKAGEAS